MAAGPVSYPQSLSSARWSPKCKPKLILEGNKEFKKHAFEQKELQPEDTDSGSNVNCVSLHKGEAKIYKTEFHPEFYLGLF